MRNRYRLDLRIIRIGTSPRSQSEKQSSLCGALVARHRTMRATLSIDTSTQAISRPWRSTRASPASPSTHKRGSEKGAIPHPSTWAIVWPMPAPRALEPACSTRATISPRPISCETNPAERRKHTGQVGGWTETRPFSLGLLPSGPDPVGEWYVHRQPPGAYLTQARRFRNGRSLQIARAIGRTRPEPLPARDKLKLG